ncbi:VosA [Purpureocillium lilacinum]|uniref:VosA n=2 Tax=Purpureocillium lilacinum TaxID=33203 RepID=A0A179HGR5_PURLI|nr:VosA [Purpureocillium lilacinum]OAQ89112.1 VosA [Purpureocillium lilacinum]
MSSSAVKLEPRGHGGVGAMSLPYNDWVPDHHRHHHYHQQHQQHHHQYQHQQHHEAAHHPHFADPSEQNVRLPPPESLVTGNPAASHFHDPSSPTSPAPFQGRLSSSTSPHSSRLPFPSLPPKFAGPVRDVVSQNVTSTARSSLEARPPPTAPAIGFIGSHEQSLPSHTDHQQLSHPVLSSQRDVHPHDYKPPLAPGPFADASQQQYSLPSAPPQPSQVRQTQPPPPRRSRQPTSGSPVPGMPNLLGPGREEALSGISFRLTLRQQPKAARACGFGDRDRRVIDPPPIVQLIVQSSTMTDDEVRSYLRYESYVMNCSICDETGSRDASFMPEEYQHQRRLMGSLVGTPFVGQDDRGDEGCFFCFSDLSCRTPGAFRLKFTLIMIDPARAGTVRHFPILTETMSDVFHVYSAKEFPGMLPSSSLAKKLKEQGCIISIKKGNDRSKNARGQDELSDMDEDEGESSQGHRKRRTVRE